MPLILRTEDAKNEGTDFGYTLARVVGENGLPLEQADIESVAVFVYDGSVTGSTAIYSDAAIDPTTVISDSLIRDRRWTLPDDGYNFSHYLDAATVFATEDEVGGHTYQIEYRIETTALNGSGNVFVVRKCRVAPIYTPRI